MDRVGFLLAVFCLGCTPVPVDAQSPTYDPGTTQAAAEAGAEGQSQETIELTGTFTQGGSAFGQAEPGATVTLDGLPLLVSDTGYFVMGFGRDHKATATLKVVSPDGSARSRTLEIAQRQYNIQRIDGLPPSKVTPYTKEALDKIAQDKAMKTAAREDVARGDWFTQSFVWPATGRISGVYGSQRILNGEPKRPHFGVDVAAVTGTPIVAPAGGKVTLASDLYFEGNAIFLDHGNGLTSIFMHMSRLDVAPGDMVEQGQVLGAVGSTGRSTGPHLHWGMYLFGRQLDPQLLVPPMVPQ